MSETPRATAEVAGPGEDPYGLVLQNAVDALAAGRGATADAVVRHLSSDVSVAVVWDFDHVARELVCRHASLVDLIDRRIPLGVSVAGWVASHRRPTFVVERGSDRRGDHYAGDPRVPTAGAAVPIPGAEQYTGGVLEVYGEGAVSMTTAGLVGLGRLAAVIAAGAQDLHPGGDPAETSGDSVTEVERQNRRMAAELHDGVSQRLASLSFHLAAANSALAELSPEPDTSPSSDPVRFAVRQLTAASELSQLAADDVRAAISGLRPPVLDDLGLAKGLVSLCGALGAGDLAVEVDVEAVEPPFVSPAASLALYRVTQEALGNAVKHAGVAAVRVRLHRRGDHVILDVRDDGVGYRQGLDGTAEPRPAGHDRGLGLRSMAERIRAVGGELELWSAPGRGTHVRAIVPDPPDEVERVQPRPEPPEVRYSASDLRR